jgi:host factor-I protein
MPPQVHRAGIIPNVQDSFLSTLCRERTPACIYLVNGIKLFGYLKAFDQYTLYLDDPIVQIVYKHSICSILPVDPKTINNGIDTVNTRQRFSAEKPPISSR